MKKSLLFLFLAAMTLLLDGCYRNKTHVLSAPDSVIVGDIAPQVDTIALKQKRDSLLFALKHHYSENFNFLVYADSLQLYSSQPEEVASEMQIDSFFVYRNEHLAVADIRILPTDSIDSVWVQLARDQITFGWTRESQLLPCVVPDDPVSQFITAFSDSHLLIFLVAILLAAVAYIVRSSHRRSIRIVHFNDIDTPYPTALALTVATSAVLYASIQNFAPQLWRHFYFHPTLNPLIAPLPIGIFLASCWAIVIVGLAAVDEVRKRLSATDTLVYLCGLAGVCVINYIVFTFTTTYYVGYLLLAAYFVMTIRKGKETVKAPKD